MHSLDDVDDDNENDDNDDDDDLDHHYYYSEFQVFRTNVFSYHLDKRSYHIVYMFVPHKHTFEIAQI